MHICIEPYFDPGICCSLLVNCIIQVNAVIKKYVVPAIRSTIYRFTTSHKTRFRSGESVISKHSENSVVYLLTLLKYSSYQYNSFAHSNQSPTQPSQQIFKATWNCVCPFKITHTPLTLYLHISLFGSAPSTRLPKTLNLSCCAYLNHNGCAPHHYRGLCDPLPGSLAHNIISCS